MCLCRITEVFREMSPLFTFSAVVYLFMESHLIKIITYIEMLHSVIKPRIKIVPYNFGLDSYLFIMAHVLQHWLVMNIPLKSSHIILLMKTNGRVCMRCYRPIHQTTIKNYFSKATTRIDGHHEWEVQKSSILWIPGSL